MAYLNESYIEVADIDFFVNQLTDTAITHDQPTGEESEQTGST